MDSNPWQVDSIQTFYGLKCPECMFFSQKEIDFKDHAMENHPMSYLLFGKSENNEEIAQIEEKSDMDENHDNVPLTSINSNPLIDRTTIKKYSSEVGIKENSDLKLLEMNSEYFVSTTNFKNDNAIIENENPVHLESSEGIRVEENSETVFVENLDMKEEYSEELDDQNDPFFSQPESDGIRMKSDSKNVLCDICNKAFGKKSTMKRHIREVHEGKKPFKCESCGSKFTQKTSLDGHIKLVHDTFSESESDGIKMKSDTKSEILQEKKPYKCPIPLSDMYFSYPGIDMKNHIRLIHEGEKPVQCSICSESFKSNKHLRSHTLHQHKQEAPHLCSICDANFSQKSKLKKHKELVHKVHEEIKTFLCNICNKAFGRKCTMRIHVSSVHEGIKPFKCESCGSSFTQKRGLDRHIKSVHEEIKKL